MAVSCNRQDFVSDQVKPHSTGPGLIEEERRCRVDYVAAQILPCVALCEYVFRQALRAVPPSASWTASKTNSVIGLNHTGLVFGAATIPRSGVRGGNKSTFAVPWRTDPRLCLRQPHLRPGNSAWRVTRAVRNGSSGNPRYACSSSCRQISSRATAAPLGSNN